MTAIFQDLQKIGLTQNQTIVYLELARFGSAKAGAIIKKTGLHRNLVYDALDELIEKRLVSVSKVRGVAVYKMLAPERLLNDISEKERIAKNAVEELSLLVKKNQQEIVVFEGIDDFRRHVMRSYTLARPGALHRYLGTSPHWHTLVGAPLEKETNRLQIEKKLRLQGISKSHFPALKGYLTATKGLTEIRINPLISSDTNNIEILEDRVCIQSLVEPYFVVEIINKEVAKNYQNYFDFLWSKSK